MQKISYIPIMDMHVSDSVSGCPMYEAFDIIGDKWVLMILIGSMSGIAHFEDYQSTLRIARNILSNRLTKLVRLNILTRQVVESDKRKVEYRLTQKGNDLAATILALRQWAERWTEHGPLRTTVVDRHDHLPIQKIMLHAHDGRLLANNDVLWLDRQNEVITYDGSGSRHCEHAD